MNKPLDFGSVSSTVLKNRPVTDDILILAVGAPENHGPHLPLATDAIVGENLAQRIGDKLAAAYPETRVWIHPTWHLGGATIRGVGSVKTPSRILRKTLKTYLRTFLRQGFRRYILISAHGGVPHTGALDDACAYLNRKQVRGERVYAIAPAAQVAGRAYMGLFADRVRAAGATLSEREAQELVIDLHAGRMETSMMLAIAPELVGDYRNLAPIIPPTRWWLTPLQKGIKRLVHRLASDEEKRRFIEAAVDIGAIDLSWIVRGRKEGYIGWPAKASAAEGEALLDNCAEEVLAVARSVFAGELDPRRVRSAAYLFRRFLAGSALFFAVVVVLLVLAFV